MHATHPEHLAGMIERSRRLTPGVSPQAPAPDGSRPGGHAAIHSMRDANSLLASLPPREQELLGPRLEKVTLRSGEVVAPAGAAVTHLYFPETAVLSLVMTPKPSGRTVDAATVGSEGMIGLSHVLGTPTTRSDAVTRVAGSAARIAVVAFDRIAAGLPTLRRRIERYAASLIDQMAQSALCVQSHTIEQRLAGLMLTIVDRVGGEPVAVTHEQLGLMLGIRRPGVTHAAATLRARGLTDYRRGRITISDRAGLSAAACACHGAISKAARAR